MLILSYELRDDPDREHEQEFETAEAASRYVQSQEGHLVWFSLTDEHGDDIKI